MNEPPRTPDDLRMQAEVRDDAIYEPPEGRWTHKHPVDPHYETTGKPAYWVCHTCRTPILLDGEKPPIATEATEATEAEPAGEPPLSSQP